MRTDTNKPKKYRNIWNSKLQIRAGNRKYPQHTNHHIYHIYHNYHNYHKNVNPALVKLMILLTCLQ
ncbi:hypothetical protein [Methanosarcina sp.]|uniref:hypothetical protein n=1 Tax=Methanosarcina sp. TaxID=2213 RepID=UPI003BB525D3